MRFIDHIKIGLINFECNFFNYLKKIQKNIEFKIGKIPFENVFFLSLLHEFHHYFFKGNGFKINDLVSLFVASWVVKVDKKFSNNFFCNNKGIGFCS